VLRWGWGNDFITKDRVTRCSQFATGDAIPIPGTKRFFCFDYHPLPGLEKKYHHMDAEPVFAGL